MREMLDSRHRNASVKPSGPTYKIIRFYRGNKPSVVIDSGLTREQAQEHCRDPETSSSTATSQEALDHTEQFGPWFDGFERES